MIVAAEPEVDYYTEARIRFWLKNWTLLETLAESMSTSAHHLDHEEGDDRPCMPSPGRVQMSRGDPLAYADVLADLRRAHASLRYQSLEWTVVDYQIRFGPLGKEALAKMVKRRRDDVTRAFDLAVVQMVRYLEGERP